MPIDPQALLARPFPEARHAWTTRDTILYALGIGLGADPMDRQALRYLYEPDLVAHPTLVNVLATPGFWAQEPDTGIDWRRLVHAEQWFSLDRPIPAAGIAIGRNRVTAFHDKGASRGALLATERTITLEDGTKLATVGGLTMLRADGGSGVVQGTYPTSQRVPDRTPDATVDTPTLPQAALLYRLSGDLNPLHVDPDVASIAGFERPILHGLCTLGIAGQAILATALEWAPAPIRALHVRFSAPVFPGETIRTEIWHEPGQIAFRATIPARGATVLDRGRLTIER